MMRSLEWFWGVSVIVLVVGVLAVVQAGLRANDRFTSIQQKTVARQELERLGIAVERSDQARERLKAESSTRPPDLEPVVRESLGPTASVQSLPARPLEAGWEIREVSIEFKAVEWKRVSSFIEKVERMRPPWQPVKLDIQAGPGTSGSGTLTVRALAEIE